MLRMGCLPVLRRAGGLQCDACWRAEAHAVDAELALTGTGR